MLSKFRQQLRVSCEEWIELKKAAHICSNSYLLLFNCIFHGFHFFGSNLQLKDQISISVSCSICVNASFTFWLKET